MSSVYMVRNDKGWAQWVRGWLFGSFKARTALVSQTSAAAVATEHGGTVVEFIPRDEVQELVTALRRAYDTVIVSDLADEDRESIIRLLKKWEPAA